MWTIFDVTRRMRSEYCFR